MKQTCKEIYVLPGRVEVSLLERCLSYRMLVLRRFHCVTSPITYGIIQGEFLQIVISTWLLHLKLGFRNMPVLFQLQVKDWER